MITFTIDALTSCLKETNTGEIFETEIIRLKRKSFLSKFNSHTGWYVNWGKFQNDIEVYALVLKGTVDVQGLIAIRNDEDSKAIQILWACTAPWNNKLKGGTQRFEGVGGHLFAVAAELSFERGFEGYVYGEAINSEVFEYYAKNFHASHIGTRNGIRRFMISGENIRELMEVYNYEWTEEEL